VKDPDVITEDARRAVERAARASYGRLLAFLSARSHDVAAAEDALADAFRAALQTWPAQGVPNNPEGWLFTAGRRTLFHGQRHAKVKAKNAAALLDLAATAATAANGEPEIPDRRLELLFVCAHPAIDAAARTPLMLQTVLGLDAGRIASAFLVAPATMAQRLVRAKTKIRDAGIAFETPEATDLPERLEAVLEAIYAAYSCGWEDIAGADPRQQGLTDEAIWLARVVVGLLPEQPEARALLALMLYCDSRRTARLDAAGNFVPLTQQDCRLWQAPAVAEAEHLLATASRHGLVGRFQLEAAIQSAHMSRAMTGVTPWAAIADLYDRLADLAPSTGLLVSRAAAVAEARGAQAGLNLLAKIPIEWVKNYQPFWVLTGHLQESCDDRKSARTSLQHAIGLTEDSALRRFLQQRLSALVD